ncbi:NAD(P)-dependent oxidoreductase [Nocardia sp. CA-107356]|uniref:NAD(P)-dependent oxidoreductase n=1 Tax=Nocardia sp. CA-107356 TaxID=3239972 RepID=UPI003D93F60A
MMRIALLGATGPSGQQVLDQALKTGHQVTVLVRDPGRLPQVGDSRVTVITGDATNTEDLKHALSGNDAVISALGAGKNFKSDIATRATRAFIPAADATGVRRVVWLSALGSGDTAQQTPALVNLGVKLLMSKLFADKAVADDLLRSSDVDWTLVYPMILTDGPRTGSYKTVDLPSSGKTGSRISRADVADFMLRAVTAEEWSHRNIALTR